MYFTPVSHRSSPAEIAYVVANSGARVVAAARAAGGEPGTIWFSSAHTALDYLGDPEKTAANRSGEFIIVGDFGYRDGEGRVFLLDRRTDLILSGGSTSTRPRCPASPRATNWPRLAEHCRAAPAGFKTPKRFDFTDRLPRTESGKMVRRTLRSS